MVQSTELLGYLLLLYHSGFINSIDLLAPASPDTLDSVSLYFGLPGKRVLSPPVYGIFGVAKPIISTSTYSQNDFTFISKLSHITDRSFAYTLSQDTSSIVLGAKIIANQSGRGWFERLAEFEFGMFSCGFEGVDSIGCRLET